MWKPFLLLTWRGKIENWKLGKFSLSSQCGRHMWWILIILIKNLIREVNRRAFFFMWWGNSLNEKSHLISHEQMRACEQAHTRCRLKWPSSNHIKCFRIIKRESKDSGEWTEMHLWRNKKHFSPIQSPPLVYHNQFNWWQQFLPCLPSTIFLLLLRVNGSRLFYLFHSIIIMEGSSDIESECESISIHLRVTKKEERTWVECLFGIFLSPKIYKQNHVSSH